MIFEEIIGEINQYLEDVLSYFNLKKSEINFEITEPPIKELGDFSTNIAFLLAKTLKKSPVDIAAHLANVLLPDILHKSGSKKYIRSISFESPGFINFKIRNDVFIQSFLSKVKYNREIIHIDNHIEKDDGLILIEHTSVNPNKALHVGHLRNAIIGDCIYRLLKVVKKNVRVLNYIDDSGVQVADIIVGLKYGGFKLDFEKTKPSNSKKKFDQYCGNEIYVKINELYPSRPDLEEKRKIILKELEDPKSDTSHFTRQIVTRVLDDQLQTCWKIRCRYDLLNFESQIVQSQLWNTIFETLRNNKIIYYEENGKNAGCWVYKSDTQGEKVLVRSDSTLTYFAKDIPYAVWKLGYLNNPFDFTTYCKQWDSSNLYITSIKKYNYEELNSREGIEKNEKIIDFDKIVKVVTVIDFRQDRLQHLLFEILGKLGINESKYNYLGYEPVILSKNSSEMLGVINDDNKLFHMSGRKGIFIEADLAINILEERSKQAIEIRNPDLSEEHVSYIAREIAISAIRYYFIRFDFGKMITFDINESLSLEGDTAPYIQYSYARGKKIIDKIIENDIYRSIEIINLDSENFSLVDINLIKHLCKFSVELAQATNSLNPKIIARYLFQLATLFNNFYEGSSILKEKNKILMSARITVLEYTLDILKNCMDIIGITPLKRM